MADMAVDNLLAALRGERMPHCANPEVYERATPIRPPP
jgi:glyoxylate reductase